jgi:hypothetical protein
VAPFNSEVDDCKVWKRVEFPTLKDNSAVTKVTLVNFENFDEKKVGFRLNTHGKTCSNTDSDYLRARRQDDGSRRNDDSCEARFVP